VTRAARRRPVAAPPPPVEPRAKVLRARVSLTLQGPTGDPVELEREVPPDALELVSQIGDDVATVDELATCEQTLAQVHLLAPTLGLPELASIMSEVIAVLRRVPGVSAELDRRGGRFPLR
jgi:hypothetical protein